jgi:hypothetical protein
MSGTNLQVLIPDTVFSSLAPAVLKLVLIEEVSVQ